MKSTLPTPKLQGPVLWRIRIIKTICKVHKAFLKAYKFYLENPEETVDIILNYIDIDRDMLMGCIYDENKMFRLEQFWPHPSPVKAYNWKFLQDLQAFDYLKSGKDILNDYVYEDSYVEAMNSLAKKPRILFMLN